MEDTPFFYSLFGCVSTTPPVTLTGGLKEVKRQTNLALARVLRNSFDEVGAEFWLHVFFDVSIYIGALSCCERVCVLGKGGGGACVRERVWVCVNVCVCVCVCVRAWVCKAASHARAIGAVLRSGFVVA